VGDLSFSGEVKDLVRRLMRTNADLWTVGAAAVTTVVDDTDVEEKVVDDDEQVVLMVVDSTTDLLATACGVCGLSFSNVPFLS
jgi:hypothetical protein